VTPEDRRIVAMTPAAHALIEAVADHDAEKVRQILGSEIDYPALVVLLADHASRAPAATYVQSILDDIRRGKESDPIIATRYRMSPTTIRNLRTEAGLAPADDIESPGELEDGRWVNRNGVQVWRPSKEVA